MGIFSDRCDALIDPTTGRALGGEALAQAKLDPKWPRCENSVRKAARFCNKCGSPAPGGWWKCPSCGKWIGNEARYCSHCNTPLYPEDRAVMAGGTWRKDPGLFAQRFEIGDVKRLLQDDLLIQEGTVAVVTDGGHIHGILESGRHNPDSLARAINWLGDPPPRSVVMVDAGDVALPLRVEGLRTAEHHPIGFYGEVILRFGKDKTASRAFFENALKDRRHLAYKDLSESLQGVVRTAVDALCVTSKLDDLVRDPERRVRLQETMTRMIGEDVARYGLQVVRVSSAEFTGDEYEEYAERLGDVDIKRREFEYADAMRKLQKKDEMDTFKDADELRSYKAIIDSEYRVSQATRDREWELLKRAWEHDDIRHRQLLEVEQAEHDIGVQQMNDEYARGKGVKDASAAALARDAAFDQEKKEAEWGLDIRNRKKAEDAQRRAGMTLEERLMDVSDPTLRRVLVEQMMAQRNLTMTPEQILAEAAATSPAAAEALAKMSDRTRQNAEMVLAEMKKLYADANERQDKNLKTFMEPAVEAAKRQAAQPQTIVH